MLYNCLLCKKSIKSDGEGSNVLDPCDLVIVAGGGTPRQQEQVYFCHFQCFLKLQPTHLQIDPDYSPEENSFRPWVLEEGDGSEHLSHVC